MSARCRPCRWMSALRRGSGETTRSPRSFYARVCCGVLVTHEHHLFILSRLHVSVCMPPSPRGLKQPGGGPVGGLGVRVRGGTGSSGGDRGRSHSGKEPIGGGGRRGRGGSARHIKVSHRPMRTSVIFRLLGGHSARLLCAAVTPPAALAQVMPPSPYPSTRVSPSSASTGVVTFPRVTPAVIVPLSLQAGSGGTHHEVVKRRRGDLLAGTER